MSCTFVLDKAPADPSYVSVKVDATEIYLDKADGWTLGADERTVEVQGKSCDTLKSGMNHSLTVNVECTQVIPL